MRTYVAATVVALAVWALSACAGSSTDDPRAAPVSSFDIYPDSVRAFSDFGAADGVIERIDVPRDATNVALHFDCAANDGAVSVRWEGRDLVAATCSSVRGEGKGIIANKLLPRQASSISS